MVAIDLAKCDRRVNRHVISGDQETMNRLASQDKGLILAENLAAWRNSGSGDLVELPTPTGILPPPVVGTIRDLSNQMGTIFLDRSLYVAPFQDDTVDVFRVYLRARRSREEGRGRIIDRARQAAPSARMLNREMRDYVAQLMNQWFGLTYFQVVVAMLVAMLGIVNTLTVSISDRRRELGVLRAVGGLRARSGTVWMEAVAIGRSGHPGHLDGAVTCTTNWKCPDDLTGIPFAYQFPVRDRGFCWSP